MIIWRGSGWLILPFFLLTWWLADGVIQPIYRSITGFEYMYNADKAMCWAIAFGVVAALILLFNLFVLPFLDKLGAAVQRGTAPQTPQAPATPAEGSGPSVQPQEAVAVSAQVTNQRPRFYSTFFFIPMHLFPIIFVVIGIIVFVTNVGTAIAEASHG